MSPTPLAQGLVSGTGDEAVLLGGRCRDCGVVTFPAQASCPGCAGEAMAEVPLPRQGTLWTWTMQRFAPKSPPYGRPVDDETFEAFALGYVDLGEVKVEARLAVAGPGELSIGMEMELAWLPLWVDDEGAEVVVLAFRPRAEVGS